MFWGMTRILPLWISPHAEPHTGTSFFIFLDSLASKPNILLRPRQECPHGIRSLPSAFSSVAQHALPKLSKPFIPFIAERRLRSSKEAVVQDLCDLPSLIISDTGRCTATAVIVYSLGLAYCVAQSNSQQSDLP